MTNKELTEKNEHLAVGIITNACEFCKSIEGEIELFTEVDGCEVYAHKKCLDRARMLIKLDWGD